MIRNDGRRRGLHIGFTGIDGAGKSTQAALLCRWFKENGTNAIVYEEKRNFVSEITDSIARTHGIDSGRRYLGEDLYLVGISFEVLRQNLLNIRPYIAIGITIISPRTVFDWLAGGIARGCSSREFKLAKEIVLFGGTPDLTIWLDVSPEIAAERILRRGFDKANLEYLHAYKEAFATLLRGYPHARIEGEEKIEIVQLKVQRVVTQFLKKER